jgi:hypothetical protein
MGMVMLHQEQPAALPLGTLRAIARGGIVRMQVGNEQLGLQREEVLVMADGLDKGAVGRVMLEIADVMTEESMALASEGEGGLELAAQGQDRLPTLEGQRKRLRGEESSQRR